MFKPGVQVDIYCPANQPSGEWVWVGGYRVSESKKQRHRRLNGQIMNPLTKQIESTITVQRGSKAFPVCESHVRLAGQGTWNYPSLNLSRSVVITGAVISDESDKADLEALNEIADIAAETLDE